MSIRLKFALIMAVPLVLVYLTMNIIQFYELGHTTLDEERAGAKMMVRLQTEEVSAYARLAELRTNGILAAVDAVPEIADDRLVKFLAVTALPPWIAGVGLLDTRFGEPRKYFATNPNDEGATNETTATNPISKRLDTAMRLAVSRGTGGWQPAAKGTQYTTPIFVHADPAQKVAVAIAVDARELTSLVLTADNRADPWIVIDTKGTVILGRPEASIGKHIRKAFGDVPTAEMDDISARMATESFGSVELKEPHYWLGWNSVDSTPWHLFLPIDMREIMAPVWSALWRDALIAVLGLILNLTIVVLLTRWFTRPIRRLSEAFHTVEHGDFAVRVPVNSKDEMGQMASGFNDMTDQLSNLVQAAAKDETEKAVLAREIGIAADMQASLIPPSAQLPDNEVGRVRARMKPALEVGGDFYDAWTKKGSTWFTVADVSGKGVGAGLFMAVASTVLRGVRPHVDDPADALRWLNDRLLEDGAGRPVFLTMFLGRLDPDGTVDFASAGHLPAILFGPNGARTVADATGPPVGMSTQVDWTTGTLHLEPGEHLFVYSDGAVEARRSDGSMVEIEGLMAMLQDTLEIDDDERVETLVSALTKLQTDGQFDDITVMSITRPRD